MISAILARSGGPPAAALTNAKVSRKYSGPSAAGVITQSTFASRRNADCLSRPNIDLFPIQRPGQHTVDAIDRFFEMVVAVRRSRQSLGSCDKQLKGRNAAIRVVASQQEADREALGGNGFFGGIDVGIDDFRWHCANFSSKLTLL